MLKYGVYSGIVVILVYLPVQKALYYFMVHVYLYLHPVGAVPLPALVAVLLANMALCIGMALFACRAVLREGMLEQAME
ncbi:MAG: hypothetical protein K2N87_09265 [Eubacterium sp.]|nr:hypothetical protein [Eubacterium sp.]